MCHGAVFLTLSSPFLDVCSSTPSGECVVGRCWEVCSSWVPVCLVGLIMARWIDSKRMHYCTVHKIVKDRHNRAAGQHRVAQGGAR